MIRYIFQIAGFVILLSTACTKNQDFQSEKASMSAVSFILPFEARSFKLDLDKSNIRWKGTKMLGTGGHEGVVDINEGFLLFSNDSLVGGKVTADMNTIRITGKSDYKEEDMRMLSNYLKKRALTAEKYPLATFEISKVNYLGGGDLRVWGNMTIKDVTKNISIPAAIKGSGNSKRFQAELALDRFDWNIGVDGNLLENNLVDREFGLQVELVTIK